VSFSARGASRRALPGPGPAVPIVELTIAEPGISLTSASYVLPRIVVKEQGGFQVRQPVMAYWCEGVLVQGSIGPCLILLCREKTR
jgi:hypothetical protein